MAFLHKLGVLERFKLPPNNGMRWRLSPAFKGLWDDVVGK